jgi:drug/metabolite transporter (DMT)-like permease
MKTDTLAKLACAFSGLVWGLFWIPIRALAEAGISGLWAGLFFYGVPFVLVLPLLFWNWRETVKGGLWLQFMGFTAAASLVIYSVSMLYTEVVRAMLLFYLTPLWSTVLARIFLGDPITRLRLVAMALGIAGMLVIFRTDMGVPLPQNSGDRLGLASGVLWAIASILMRADKGTATVQLFTQNFIWSGIVALAFVLLIHGGLDASPPLSLYLAQLPWLLPIVILIVMSGVYASMWGTPKLNPGLVGLLFMTEISVGAITAALWAGEPFGWREAIGIVLITGAGILESLRDIWNSRRSAANAN